MQYFFALIAFGYFHTLQATSSEQAEPGHSSSDTVPKSQDSMHNAQLLESLSSLFEKDLRIENFAELYKEGTFETIRRMSAGILSATNPEDILLFVGNSPSYYYHVVKNERPRSFLVPMSCASVVSNEHMLLTEDETLAKYDEVFLEPIRKLAAESQTPPTLVYIDKTYAGQTVGIFDRLLRRNTVDIFGPSELIQIAYTEHEWHFIISNPVNMKVRKMLLAHTKIVDFTHGRLVPWFPKHLWHLSDPLIMELYESLPGPAHFISSISDYAKQHGLEEPAPDNSPLVTLADRPITRYQFGPAPFYQPHIRLPLSLWTECLVTILNERLNSIDLDSTKSQEMNLPGLDPRHSVAHQADYLGILIHISKMNKFNFIPWASRIVQLATFNPYIESQVIAPLMALIDRTCPPESKDSLYSQIGLSDFVVKFPASIHF